MNETTTQQLPPPEPRRLVRARDGRVVGGVCAGLGRYFNVDPIIFRIGTIVLTFVGGAGVLAKRAALGLGILFVCGLIGIGGAWAAAAGGETVVAIAVILAGAAIVAGGFMR